MATGRLHRTDSRTAMHWTQSFGDRSGTGLGLDFDSVGKSDEKDSWWGDTAPSESNIRSDSTDHSEYNSLGLSIASVQASVTAYSTHLATSSLLRFSSTFDDNPRFEQSNPPQNIKPDLRNRCPSIELFPELHMSMREAIGQLHESEMQLKEFGFEARSHPGFPPTPEDELDYASGWSSPLSDARSSPSFVTSPEPQPFVDFPTPPAVAGEAPTASVSPRLVSPTLPAAVEEDSAAGSILANVQPENENDSEGEPAEAVSIASPEITPSTLPTPSDPVPTFYWCAADIEFYPVSSRTDLSDFDEIVSFPRECFTTGQISQDETYPMSNAFIREQRCFGDCKFNFRDGVVKPVRLRAHFSTCEMRKKYFKKLGVTDGFGRACELQLETLRADRSAFTLGLNDDAESSPTKKRKAFSIASAKVTKPKRRVKV